MERNRDEGNSIKTPSHFHNFLVFGLIYIRNHALKLALWGDCGRGGSHLLTERSAD